MECWGRKWKRRRLELEASPKGVKGRKSSHGSFVICPEFLNVPGLYVLIVL